MNGSGGESGTSLVNEWTPQTVAALTFAIVNDPNDRTDDMGTPSDTTDDVMNPDDNKWDSASDSTKGAWDFGTSSQIPALKYADYNGVGTMFHCESDARNAPPGAILIAQTVGS